MRRWILSFRLRSGPGLRPCRASGADLADGKANTATAGGPRENIVAQTRKRDSQFVLCNRSTSRADVREWPGSGWSFSLSLSLS